MAGISPMGKSRGSAFVPGSRKLGIPNFLALTCGLNDGVGTSAVRAATMVHAAHLRGRVHHGGASSSTVVVFERCRSP